MPELDVDRHYVDGTYEIYIQGPDGEKRAVARTDDWDRTYFLMRVVRDTLSIARDFMRVDAAPEDDEDDDYRGNYVPW